MFGVDLGDFDNDGYLDLAVGYEASPSAQPSFRWYNE